MSKLNSVLAAVGSLFDEIAGLAPGQLANEIGLVVVALTTLGVLHVANANGFANAVAALILALAMAGVAVERAVKAAK